MKLHLRKQLCAGLAATLAMTALVGCSTETPESTFDNPPPWHDSANSYEKLDYSVAIYDTTDSTDEDKRVKIADGALSYTLTELESGYVSLAMEFSVTYAADAPAPDAGLTDKITSYVEFEMNSLAARTMTKTVELADRENTVNRSYTVTADYFVNHTATYIQTKIDGAAEQTMSLTPDLCRDNEMMFYIARAQKIGEGVTGNFKMVNIFDSFNKGEFTQYRIATSCGELHNLDIGDWVKDYGVEAVTDEETGVTNYPISARYTSLVINDEKHGPPYIVLYSEQPFTSDGKEHKKIPVRIEYSSYRGSTPYRHTEYTLNGCSFTKSQDI